MSIARAESLGFAENNGDSPLVRADLIAKDHAFNIAAYISSGAVRASLSSYLDFATFSSGLELVVTLLLDMGLGFCSVVGLVGDA